MKTVLALLVTAAVLLATYRVGHVYWDHYQFEDAVKEAAQFSDRNKADDLAARVLDIAERMEIPLAPDQLSITREQRRVTVDAAYARTVEILPGFSRDLEFAVHVSVLSMN
jgi:hypothetical protein